MRREGGGEREGELREGWHWFKPTRSNKDVWFVKLYLCRPLKGKTRLTPNVTNLFLMLNANYSHMNNDSVVNGCCHLAQVLLFASKWVRTSGSSHLVCTFIKAQHATAANPLNLYETEASANVGANCLCNSNQPQQRFYLLHGCGEKGWDKYRFHP